jgi:hypothetical protein
MAAVDPRLRVTQQTSFFEIYEQARGAAAPAGRPPRVVARPLTEPAPQGGLVVRPDAFECASSIVEVRLVDLPPAELRQLAPGNRFWKDVREARGVAFGSFAVATIAPNTGAWASEVKCIDVCVPHLDADRCVSVLPSVEPGAPREISTDGPWRFNENIFALVTIGLRNVPPGMAVSQVRAWVLAPGAPPPAHFVLATAPAPVIACALDGERAFFCPVAADRGYVRPRGLAAGAEALVAKYEARGMFQTLKNAAQQSDGRSSPVAAVEGGPSADAAASQAAGCAVC